MKIPTLYAETVLLFKTEVYLYITYNYTYNA